MKAAKSGCGASGFGFEFGVKLATDKPRVVRGFDDFNVNAVRRAPSDSESGSRERFLILAVELVAMAVPLGNVGGSVRLRRKGTRLKFAGHAEPHRSPISSTPSSSRNL